MAQHQLVNAEHHQDIYIAQDFGEHFGDQAMTSHVFPIEFRQLQANYPLCFQKSLDTGEFYPVALLGFQQGENLFLANGEWHSNYLPLMVRRQPFLIGFQSNNKAVIHIDINHSRINKNTGERLFEKNGEPSKYLNNIARILDDIHFGHQQAQQFCSLLTKFDLIEPFTLDVTLNNGKEHQLVGFYTINEENLAGLNAEQLAALHQHGFLQSCYFMSASLSCFKDLIDKKKAKSL